MKIGIISENKNDSIAIGGLLKKKYHDVVFFPILPDFTGDSLDDKNSNKVIITLRRNFEIYQPDFILYIRDLDASIEDKIKITFRKKRFQKFKKVVDGKAIFMLNIYELEALILADFDTFKILNNNENWFFEAKNASITPEPDKILSTFTAYDKGEARIIIPQLSFEKILENHIHFRNFILEFEKMLANKRFHSTPY